MSNKLSSFIDVSTKEQHWVLQTPSHLRMSSLMCAVLWCVKTVGAWHCTTLSPTHCHYRVQTTAMMMMMMPAVIAGRQHMLNCPDMRIVPLLPLVWDSATVCQHICDSLGIFQHALKMHLFVAAWLQCQVTAVVFFPALDVNIFANLLNFWYIHYRKWPFPF